MFVFLLKEKKCNRDQNHTVNRLQLVCPYVYRFSLWMCMNLSLLHLLTEEITDNRFCQTDTVQAL